MSKYIYIRVSTEEQNYGQQMNCIENYFARTGEDMSRIDAIYREKKSGKISYKDRPQMNLMTQSLKGGDTVFVSDFSRLGRNLIDVMKFVEFCDSKGVTIITCKDGQRIEAGSVLGKCLIFAFGVAAEIQVQNISQNTKDGIAAARAKGKQIGRKKGCDLTKAYTASCEVRMNAAKEWRENSPAYQIVKRWVLQGYSSRWILNEISVLHEAQPDVYCTRTGLGFDLQTISLWRGKIKKEFLAQAENQTELSD